MVINDLGINFAGGGGGGTGSTAVLTSATFSANSAYTPAQGVDGWSAVTVNVPGISPATARTNVFLSNYSISYTSSNVTAYINTDVDWELYVDGTKYSYGSSGSTAFTISFGYNYDNSEIQHAVRTNFLVDEGLMVYSLETVVQDANVYYAQATFVATADSQTMRIKGSGFTVDNNVKAYINGTQINGDTYEFPSAGTYTVYYGLNQATIISKAFADAEMTTLSASTGVNGIGDSAIQFCQNLESVSMPGVTTIANKGLRQNPKLESIDFIGNVTSMGNNAIAGTKLSALTINSGLTTMGYSALQQMSSLESVVFNTPSSIYTIENGMFSDDTALTGVTFPDSVTGHTSSVTYPTFKNCSSLQSVTFGKNTANIGAGMFSVGNSSLTEIHCNATTAPTLGGNDFDSITGNTGTLYIPYNASSYSTWITALGENWTVEYVYPDYYIKYHAKSKQAPFVIYSQTGSSYWNASVVSDTFSNGVGYVVFNKAYDMPTNAYQAKSGFTGKFEIHGCNKMKRTSGQGGALVSCSSINEIYVDADSVTSATFAYCTSMTSITFSSRVTYLGANPMALTPCVAIHMEGQSEPAEVSADFFKQMSGGAGTFYIPSGTTANYQTMIGLLPDGWVTVEE